MRHLVIAGLVLATSSAAQADTSKALAAARDQLPATTRVLGAVDVGAIAKQPWAAAFVASAIAQDRDLGEMHKLATSACKVDPVSVIDGLIVAGDPETERGVVLFQLTLDRPKAAACLEAVMKAVKPGKSKLAWEGDTAVLTVGRDTAYIAWLSSHVVAIAFKPEQRAELTAWTGQKGAFGKAPIAARLAKVDTKAIAWFAAALAKPLDDKELPVTGGHGAITLGKAGTSLAVHGTFTDAKAAAKLQAEAQKEVGKVIAKPTTPEPARRLAKALAIVQKGADVSITGTASEADTAAVLLELMK